MNMSDLMHFVKTDSIKNFIRASEVKTASDIERLNKQNYAIGYTYDELNKIFHSPVAENICYNNGFDKTFYFDRDKLVLFKMNMIGKQSIYPLDELNIYAMNTAIRLEKEAEKGDFTSSLICLDDKMRMELLNMIVEQDRLTDTYQVFNSFYQTSDYGCSELTLETMRKLISSKTDEQRMATAESLKNFPDKVTVYRGEGEKSAALSETLSWTTDINIANFFATRMVGADARIYIAEVDKCDIIEYLDSEKECIILPENIKHKDSIMIYGTDYFSEAMPSVAPRYLEYRNYITDILDFEINDDEHGRLHTARVLLNALFIAREMKLTDEETDRLCLACVIHDVGRNNNGVDSSHGERSVEIYKAWSEDDPKNFPYNETVEKLIKYHCLPDEEGRVVMDKDEQKLFDIIKDADALDRVRFGIRDLDMKQLRTKSAKSMTMLAELAVRGLQLPEQDMNQGMNMS